MSLSQNREEVNINYIIKSLLAHQSLMPSMWLEVEVENVFSCFSFRFHAFKSFSFSQDVFLFLLSAK